MGRKLSAQISGRSVPGHGRGKQRITAIAGAARHDSSRNPARGPAYRQNDPAQAMDEAQGNAAA